MTTAQARIDFETHAAGFHRAMAHLDQATTKEPDNAGIGWLRPCRRSAGYAELAPQRPDLSPAGLSVWRAPDRRLGDRQPKTGSHGPVTEEDEMNPWTAQCVAAEHTKELHRQAATKRLARQARHRQPVPRSRPLRQFTATARTASPRPA